MIRLDILSDYKTDGRLIALNDSLVNHLLRLGSLSREALIMAISREYVVSRVDMYRPFVGPINGVCTKIFQLTFHKKKTTFSAITKTFADIMDVTRNCEFKFTVQMVLLTQFF